MIVTSALALLVGFASSHHQVVTVEKEEAKPTSAASSAAVMLSLDEFFAGKWSYGKVYIQAIKQVPAGLDRVGEYEAEVISEEDLAKRFEGKENAPAFARVSIAQTTEKGETFYEVGISYTALKVKGAKSFPLGGGKSYKYKVQGGKVELMQSTTVRY